MKFSFGIITSIESKRYLKKVLRSIKNQHIPDEDYEILVVGGDEILKNEKIRFIRFDDNLKKGWITKKKNLITEFSKFENIVFLHDYVALNNNWYDGFKKFGNDFSICMNKITNYDYSRYRDWTLWTENNHELDNILNKKNSECLIPYDIKHLSKFMYISGAYWVAKKNIMESYPLNEDLAWGEGEDVEWSKRVRKYYNFDFNPFSKVKLLKYKDPIFTEPNNETLKLILSTTSNS